MRRAATDAFNAALLQGLDKEMARAVAREAGQASYKAAKKAAKRAAAVATAAHPALSTVPAPPLPEITSRVQDQRQLAPQPPPPSPAAAAPPTAASSQSAAAARPFARPVETPEAVAERLRALAIEKAERLVRAEKEAARLKANPRRVVRSDRF